MTASVEVKAPLLLELMSSVADPVRRSASRLKQGSHTRLALRLLRLADACCDRSAGGRWKRRVFKAASEAVGQPQGVRDPVRPGHLRDKHGSVATLDSDGSHEQRP